MTDPLDLSVLAALREVVEKATAGFESWDYTRSLEVTETFFWTFCDDYLELVKDRAYGSRGEAGAASARATLRLALDVVLRLLAPSSPTSPRRSGPGPTRARCTAPRGRRSTRCRPEATRACSRAVGAALAVVRKAKSEAKVGMRAEVPTMTLVGPEAALGHVRSAEADLRAAGKLTGTLEYADRRRGRGPRRRARPGRQAHGLTA